MHYTDNEKLDAVKILRLAAKIIKGHFTKNTLHADYPYGHKYERHCALGAFERAYSQLKYQRRISATTNIQDIYNTREKRISCAKETFITIVNEKFAKTLPEDTRWNWDTKDMRWETIPSFNDAQSTGEKHILYGMRAAARKLIKGLKSSNKLSKKIPSDRYFYKESNKDMQVTENV